MVAMQTLFDAPPYRESISQRLSRAVRARVEKLRFRVKIERKPRDEDPDEPFAMVGAPLKPRTPLRTLRAHATPDS